MTKYALNLGVGKGVLHSMTCPKFDEMHEYYVSYDAKGAFAVYRKKVEACGRCLRKDAHAHALIEAHNSSLHTSHK